MQRDSLRVVRRIVPLHCPQAAVLEGPHSVDPRLHGGVDEAAVNPCRDFILLLTGHVWILPCPSIVLSSIEGHSRFSTALRVESVVTPLERMVR